MEFLIGIVIGLVGLAVCFMGLRMWFYLLPIFGAIIGFFLGARIMQDFFGTGFLSTGVSWIVGIVIGIIFALLSWFVWYAGVIIEAGAVGALLFSGILHAIFTEPWGAVAFIIAAIGAVIFAVGALLLNLPIYIVIVNSALGGAALAVAGLMMLLGRITTAEIANGATVAVVDESKFQGAGWLWVILWIVLAVVGIFYQLRGVAEVMLPEEKWIKAQPA
ncbi:MAG: DUF4203 domain-containing protein [Thermomicrobiales bacterium]